MATVCNTDKFAMHHECHTAEHTDKKKKTSKTTNIVKARSSFRKRKKKKCPMITKT
jgi:hypothetical protein